MMHDGARLCVHIENIRIKNIRGADDLHSVTVPTPIILAGNASTYVIGTLENANTCDLYVVKMQHVCFMLTGNANTYVS